MESLYLYVFGALFAAWVFVITRFVHKSLNRTLLYTQEPTDDLPEDWKPFARFDRKRWREWEIYIGAIFLFPVRTLGILISVMYLALTAVLLGYESPEQANTEFPVYKRFIIKYTAKFVSRSILFCCGYFWVPIKHRKITEFDPTYPAERYASRQKEAPQILVSNHVAWTDIMAITGVWSYVASFLSKKDVASYPFFGKSAIGLQCIFVERESEAARLNVLDQITRRCAMLQEGKNVPPIIIFPEGTVNNTRYLLSFKKGAFEALRPIKILLLKYQDRYFNPAMDSLPLGCHYVILLSQFRNILHAEEFDTYFPDHLNLKEPEDWEKYARVIKNIMVKALGVKDVQTGFRNSKDYLEFIKKQNKELIEKKRGAKRDKDGETSDGNQATPTDKKSD